MKKSLFTFLVLSSGITYSADIAVNVTKKEASKPLRTYPINSSYLDEEKMNSDIETIEKENNFLNDKPGTHHNQFNKWKIFKGVVGLWLGSKFFLSGSKGLMYLAFCPDHVISQMLISPSAPSLLPLENFASKRAIWISLFGTITAFSGWILKRAGNNLYQGLYNTEEPLKIF